MESSLHRAVAGLKWSSRSSGGGGCSTSALLAPALLGAVPTGHLGCCCFQSLCSQDAFHQPFVLTDVWLIQQHTQASFVCDYSPSWTADRRRMQGNSQPGRLRLRRTLKGFCSICVKGGGGGASASNCCLTYFTLSCAGLFFPRHWQQEAVDVSRRVCAERSDSGHLGFLLQHVCSSHCWKVCV